MVNKIICPMCKGNGFTRHKFEAESGVIQCKTCKSEGELEDKYYLQTYLDGDNNPIWYHGPLHLSTDSLKKFKIHLK